MKSISNPQNIRIEDYDYVLPEDRIAQFPIQERDRSKLLIFRDGEISEDQFFRITEYVPERSVIIFNETKVIHARLIFHKDTGSRIEIFCLGPFRPGPDHQIAFRHPSGVEWQCMIGNSRRWKNGILKMEAPGHHPKVELFAERVGQLSDATSLIRFTWEPASLSFGEVLTSTGKIPLPPYIHRDSGAADTLAYQTIFARHEGSVAAPTAGLRFSDSVMKALEMKGIEPLKLTLHVGAGTFKPVSTELIGDHSMHAEDVYLQVQSLVSLRSVLNNPVIAVGTTTTRVLESLYWHGVKVINGLSDARMMDVRQWDPYGVLKTNEISREQALDAVIEGCLRSRAESVRGKTSLLIAPGYDFRYPDYLVTNFHQPKSTLLLLISAFIGDEWRTAYKFAMEREFRFLSYGDSCLLTRKKIS